MGKEAMIKLGECELDYPTITRFKVWWKGKVRDEGLTRQELVNKWGDKWLDKAHEEGVRGVEIYLI